MFVVVCQGLTITRSTLGAIEDEKSVIRNQRGSLSMYSFGAPDTSGSQVSISSQRSIEVPTRPGVVFGAVRQGMHVVHEINSASIAVAKHLVVIRNITIVYNRVLPHNI